MDNIDDWSTLKVGDVVWEDGQGGSVQIKVLSRPAHINGQWKFKAKTPAGNIEYLKTDGAEHYGPRLSTRPSYMPYRYLTTPKTEDSELKRRLAEAVEDGLSNHSKEFANPWIFKKNYSHEELADILRDILASERLFRNLEALIASQTQEAYKKGYIDGGIEMSSQVTAAENRLLDALSTEIAMHTVPESTRLLSRSYVMNVIASHRPQTTSNLNKDNE